VIWSLVERVGGSSEVRRLFLFVAIYLFSLAFLGSCMMELVSMDNDDKTVSARLKLGQVRGTK
jgi:hypothetical protein